MLKVSVAAKFLGVSADTLRRWEEEGKLIPSRTPAGYRLYSKTALKQFQQKGSKLKKETTQLNPALNIFKTENTPALALESKNVNFNHVSKTSASKLKISPLKTFGYLVVVIGIVLQYLVLLNVNNPKIINESLAARSSDNRVLGISTESSKFFEGFSQGLATLSGTISAAFNSQRGVDLAANINPDKVILAKIASLTERVGFLEQFFTNSLGDLPTIGILKQQPKPEITQVVFSLPQSISYYDLIGNTIIDSFGNLYPANGISASLGTYTNPYTGLNLNNFSVNNDGHLYANGSVDLGNSSDDTINFAGTITSNFIPTTTNSYTLGNDSHYFSNAFLTAASIGTLSVTSCTGCAAAAVPEADTLATVTARGATTSTALTLSGTVTLSGVNLATSSNNTGTIGTTGTKFATGYFGTSVVVGSTTLTDNSLSFGGGSYVKDASGKLQLQAGGATAGNGSNGSIYFLDSSAVTRGRVDTATTTSQVGSSADGACTVSSGSTDISASSCAGRATADGKMTNIASAVSAGATTLTVGSCTGFAANDEVLLIQMITSGSGAAGSYESRIVSSCSSTTLTLTAATTNAYGASSAQVIRVPNYTSVTVSSGATLTTSVWGGTTGGVLAIRASGTLSNAGTIDMNSKGFTGGTAGTAGTGATTANNAGTAGSGNAGSGLGGGATGGGGGGGNPSSGNGGGGGGGSGAGGTGGAYASAGTAGTAGGTGATGGKGGSPVDITGGTGGTAGIAGSASSIYGGATLTSLYLGSGGGSGAGGGGGGKSNISSAGNGGNGGAGGAGGIGGGIIYIGAATLSNTGTIRSNGAAGSAGSVGIIGAAGANGDGLGPSGSGGGGGASGGGGGGGSGGSVFLQATTATLGTTTASGGSGGASGSTGGGGGIGGTNSDGRCGGGGGGGAGNGGGAGGGTQGTGSGTSCLSGSTGSTANAAGGTGGDGRVRNEAASTSGSSTPTASTSTTLASAPQTSTTNSYGTLYIGATNTSAADLAEYYVTGDKSIEAGDVVVFSNTRLIDSGGEEHSSKGVLRKSQGGYAQKLAGIISTDPGVILGSIDGDTGAKDKRILALQGRIPVKVTFENGNIEVGDLLTSSATKEGYAMKAIKPGPVVAKALEAFSCATDQVCTGTIMAFAHLSYADPLSLIASNISLDKSGAISIKNLKTSDISLVDDVDINNPDATPSSRLNLKDELASISARLDQLELQPASGSGSLSQLAVLEATVSGVLKSLGDTFLGNTILAGNFSIDGTLSFTGNSISSIGKLFIQNGPLATIVDFFNGKVTIDDKGEIKAVKVTTDQLKISNKSSGKALIPAGQTEVVVENLLILPTTTVLLTPNLPLSQSPAVIEKVAGSSFKIKLATPESFDIEVSYLLIEGD